MPKDESRERANNFFYKGTVLALGGIPGRWFSEDEYNQIVALIDGSNQRVMDAEGKQESLEAKVDKYKEANTRMAIRIRTQAGGDYIPPQGVVPPETKDASPRLQDRPPRMRDQETLEGMQERLKEMDVQDLG